MFVEMLDQHKRELYYQLCIHAVTVDNVIAEEEINTLEEFKAHWHITDECDKPEVDLKDVLKELGESCTDMEKRIIIYELVGFFYADSEYAESEKELMAKVEDAFGVSGDETERLSRLVERYIDLYLDTYNEISFVG